MRNYQIGIFFAGWEPRFRLGFERDIKESRLLNAVIFYSMEYEEWTLDDRNEISKTLLNLNVKHTFIPIEHTSPHATWKTVQGFLDSIADVPGDVFIDISTIPRDVLWVCLTLLSLQGRAVDYVYHKPAGYGEWLSADPLQPRMLYRHSGVCELDKPLAVLATTGYDFDRTLRLYTTFESVKMLLAIQKGSQFNNTEMNIRDHLKWATGKMGEGVVTFSVDAYSQDHGLRKLRNHITPLLGTHNIVLAALGPKTSAVAVYKIWREYQSSALVYIPCRTYNREYSYGIGDTLAGSLQPQSTRVLPSPSESQN